MKFLKSLSFLFSQFNFNVFLLLGIQLLALPDRLPGQSQDVVKLIDDENNLRFRHITLEDGLLQSSIKSVYQDSRGFIWIGTEDGLHKYDGYEFKIFRHIPGDSTSLSNNFVNSIVEDDSGNLWIGTNFGLNLLDYKTESLTHFLEDDGISSLSHYSINTLIFDSLEHSIWIGSNSGLVQLILNTNHPDSVHFKHYPLPNQSLISPFKDHIWKLFLDSKKDLWIGTRSGLYKMERETKKIKPITAYEKEWINDLVEDPDGLIWICLNGGIEKIYKDSLTSIPQQMDLSQLGIFNDTWGGSIFKDIYGNMWIGTTSGLLQINPNDGSISRYRKEYGNANTINGHMFSSMIQDNSGLLWIGTYGGIDLLNLDEQRFTYHNLPYQSGPGKDVALIVRSLLEDNDGTLWVGTQSGRLFNMDKGQSSLRPFFVPPNPVENNFGTIKAIKEDKESNIWLATTKKGLVQIDKKTGKFQIKNIGMPRIDDLLFDKNGYIWTGNLVSLIRFNTIDQSILSFGNKSNETLIIRCLTQDSKGIIWIGTYGQGLFKFDTNLTKDAGLKMVVVPIPGKDTTYHGYDVINYILPDDAGFLWIGTYGGGLVKMDTQNETFSFYNSSNTDLEDDIIYGIQKDHEGNLWISTNAGISQFDPILNSVWTFNIDDGLQSNEFNSGVCDTGKDGKMYFGGINGFNSFQPGQIQRSDYPPPIVFTEFQINNKLILPDQEQSPLERNINETETLVLSHRQSNISFKVAALDYYIPKNNQFAYSMVLEGQSESWDTIGTRRFIGFTNLSHGTYKLKVKGTNHDGVWSDKVKSMTIIITPHWSKTWWALCIYLLLFLAICFLIFYSIYRWKKQKDSIKHQKEKEALKSKFYTNITHNFRAPLTVIEGMTNQLKENEKVKKIILRNSRKLLRQINQLLDVAKLESNKIKLDLIQSDVIIFLKYLTQSYQSFALTKKIKLTSYSEVDELIMDYDKDRLQEVVTNLLHNAIKFTPKNGEVFLHSNVIGEKKGGNLVIKVKDNGIGIDKKFISQIFDRYFTVNNTSGGTGIGLAICKEFVELMGGSISVKSKLGKGTEFKIMLPVKNEAPLTSFKYKDDSSPLLVIEGDGSSEEVIENVYKDNLPRLLIIEDNQDINNYYATSLSNKFNIEIALDGQEGIEKAIEKVPDIIICDVKMPKKDGFEVLDTLRSNELTIHIPILLVTGKDENIDKIKGMDLGADRYLIKPVDEQILHAHLARLLKQTKQLHDKFSQKIISNFPLENDNLPIEDPMVKKVIQMIKDQLWDFEFSVDKLAKQIGISREQLYRKIKSQTNKSTQELISFLRLSKAQKLLLTTDKRVSEIAYDVGLEPAYFSRVFKQEHNLSPKEYRKKYRK